MIRIENNDSIIISYANDIYISLTLFIYSLPFKRIRKLVPEFRIVKNYSNF